MEFTNTDQTGNPLNQTGPPIPKSLLVNMIDIANQTVKLERLYLVEDYDQRTLETIHSYIVTMLTRLNCAILRKLNLIHIDTNRAEVLISLEIMPLIHLYWQYSEACKPAERHSWQNALAKGCIEMLGTFWNNNSNARAGQLVMSDVKWHTTLGPFMQLIYKIFRRIHALSTSNLGCAEVVQNRMVHPLDEMNDSLFPLLQHLLPICAITNRSIKMYSTTSPSCPYLDQLLVISCQYPVIQAQMLRYIMQDFGVLCSGRPNIPTTVVVDSYYYTKVMSHLVPEVFRTQAQAFMVLQQLMVHLVGALNDEIQKDPSLVGRMGPLSGLVQVFEEFTQSKEPKCKKIATSLNSIMFRIATHLLDEQAENPNSSTSTEKKDLVKRIFLVLSKQAQFQNQTKRKSRKSW